MSKPVLIAPATMVLRLKTINLPTKQVVPARRPVVLVPLPAGRLYRKNFDQA